MSSSRTAVKEAETGDKEDEDEPVQVPLAHHKRRPFTPLCLVAPGPKVPHSSTGGT